MPSRELITLQLGPQAGWVGAHFWNGQDLSVEDGPTDPGVLFRETHDHHGAPTMTPRLLVIDHAANLGSLSLEREAPAEETDAQGPDTIAWGQNRHTVKQDPAPRHPYLRDLDRWEEASPPSEEPLPTYDFADTVHYWPDYLRYHLHPDSLAHSLLPPSLLMQHHAQGVEALRQPSRIDEILEGALRRALEECDYPQGFHIIASPANGWGGAASAILEYLEEEHPRLGRLHAAPTVIPEAESDIEGRGRLCNTLLSLTGALASSSTYLPLLTPASLLPLGSSWYRRAGPMSSVLDLLSLPYRQRSGSGGMAAHYDYLSCQGDSTIINADLLLNWPTPSTHATWPASSSSHSFFPQPRPSLVFAKYSTMLSDPLPIPTNSDKEGLIDGLSKRGGYPTESHRSLLIPSPYYLPLTYPLLAPERLEYVDEAVSALVTASVGGEAPAGYLRSIAKDTRDSSTRAWYAAATANFGHMDASSLLADSQEIALSHADVCAEALDDSDN